MFGNYFFFFYFLFPKFFFLLLKLKTYLTIQNGEKTKTVLKTQFAKEIENMQKVVFSFYF